MDGSFRADLYHRLIVFKVILPPLRDAVEDLDELARYSLPNTMPKQESRSKTYPMLCGRSSSKAYYWPGSVRELRNVIERCVLFSDGSTFPAQWLQLPGQENSHITDSLDTGNNICLPLDGSMALDDMDKFIIRTALERADNNLTAAAKALGATRETLRYRVRKYNLKVSE